MRYSAETKSVRAAILSGLTAFASVYMASSPSAAQALESAQIKSADAAAPEVTKSAVHFSASDRAAALESVQFALSEVSDGASYVWHRGNGHLSGVVQPTQSFLDTDGRVCRHVIVLLSAGLKSRKTEAVACRLDNGVWRFDG